MFWQAVKKETIEGTPYKLQLVSFANSRLLLVVSFRFCQTFVLLIYLLLFVQWDTAGVRKLLLSVVSNSWCSHFLPLPIPFSLLCSPCLSSLPCCPRSLYVFHCSSCCLRSTFCFCRFFTICSFFYSKSDFAPSLVPMFVVHMGCCCALKFLMKNPLLTCNIG